MYSHGQIAWFIFPQSSWMVLLVRMISPKCTDIHIYTLGPRYHITVPSSGSEM